MEKVGEKKQAMKHAVLIMSVLGLESCEARILLKEKRKGQDKKNRNTARYRLAAIIMLFVEVSWLHLLAGGERVSEPEMASEKEEKKKKGEKKKK